MIIIIAAYSENRVIGNNGRIPWDLPDDRQRFKKLTIGNVVVMGRKTYEEIGRPLTDRVNVVISSNGNFDGCVNARSLGEALSIFPDRDIYIAGGERLYRDALSIADMMYITEVSETVEGDRYFPSFDKNEFVLTENEFIGGDFPHRFITYKKKRGNTNGSNGRT